MSDNSKIEWTDATWNPIRARSRETGKVGWHCTHVSEGCRNCYAEAMNLRLGTGLPYKPGHEHDIEVFLDEKMLLAPLRWRRPRMIFAGSMTDLFADFVTDAMLDRVFAVMALCPQHTFQVLTKRSARMRAYFSHPDVLKRINGQVWSVLGTPIGSKIKHDGNWRATLPLPNVWLGTSAEDQATADARIPDLVATPAAIRFVSAEPLLGPIDFTDIPCCDDYLDWVIVGGESGPHSRPMHPTWAREIRDQCATTGVPFFFKQRGEWSWLRESDGEWPTDSGSLIRLTYSGERHDGGYPMQRVGKRIAGRLLDGVEHNGMPHIAEPAHA